MEDYGLRMYRYGLVLHGMGRPGLGRELNRTGSPRGRIGGQSSSSRRRLEFLAANLSGGFRTLMTLTYHAQVESWEDDAARNGRIVARSKRDLNRFLSALRRELGEYLWVQEFQRRGVVHYHVLCEREVSQERVTAAWCRATEALSDADAVRHAAKVDPITDERRARGYVGRYVGKARQKVLPPGVGGAGRWWGRSRGLALVVVDEVVSFEGDTGFRKRTGIRIVRCVRKYLGKVFGFKYRGGAVVDWGGKLSSRVVEMVGHLRAFYGKAPSVSRTVEAAGCEPVEIGGGR